MEEATEEQKDKESELEEILQELRDTIEFIEGWKIT